MLNKKIHWSPRTLRPLTYYWYKPIEAKIVSLDTEWLLVSHEHGAYSINKSVFAVHVCSGEGVWLIWDRPRADCDVLEAWHEHLGKSMICWVLKECCGECLQQKGKTKCCGVGQSPVIIHTRHHRLGRLVKQDRLWTVEKLTPDFNARQSAMCLNTHCTENF